jgi:hypothetical protein
MTFLENISGFICRQKNAVNDFESGLFNIAENTLLTYKNGMIISFHETSLGLNENTCIQKNVAKRNIQR